MTLAASPSPTIFPRLPGYTIVEQLYDGSHTRVYRAVEAISQRPVIVKLLQQEYPSLDDVLRFRNQYTIAKALDLPGIVHPYNLEPYGNSYALVMEDFGGLSLQEYAQRYSLSLSEVLTIALQLTEILRDLHQKRVIHKDIKPANILIQPDSKQVKLIDFSIASLLPRETQEIQNPNRLEGTLAYLAPEQTGRMNRGIDYRSDFYAFGVTLYELLTGQLPFQSDDPMEIVYSHLTKVPSAPHELNLQIPQTVSKLVLKLMAKNAEDRYQSALGLKNDLETCLHQLKETGTIAPFEIGTHDRSDRFTIPEKLYGREAEVQTLLAAFDRVSHGSSELLLVAGFSGIGKTAVIHEVHKPLCAPRNSVGTVRQHSYFIKGKFDQFNRNIPFSAFVQAFRDLMSQLLSESDEHLHIWKTRILEALGEDAQVIIEVIPELECILGTQPPAPELAGNAAQNRFNLLFQKFIQVFTTPEHPLVMFLDDLQWAESASLNLLKRLMSEASSSHLLILGAYRDNEVFPAHPLMLTLEEIQKAQATVNTITLAPLGEPTVNQLVADTLSCTDDLARPLTQLVYQKTQGNPFFTTQFLKALHEEGWITFQSHLGYWQCDLDSMRQLVLTDDVVEFMAQQLQKLPLETQTVLKFAACIGNQFDLKTLAIVAEQSEIETASQLWKALQEGLILPINETYKFFHSQDSDDQGNDIVVAYKFLHDRVQQAAYSLIPDDQKQVTHLGIAQLLHTNTPETQLEANLFEIVNHFNIGADLITQPEKKLELAHLNLLAGRKAKATIAYSAAVNYCIQGIDLLPADSWKEHYELTLNLHLERLEAACLNTDFDQLAAWGDIILQSATSLLDTIKVYEIRMIAFRSQGQFAKVVETGLYVLKLLGVDIPTQPTPEDIGAAAQQTWKLWQGRSPASLLDLPAMSDPHQLAAMQILATLVPSAHIAAPLLLALIIFKQVEMAIRYGNSPVTTYSYADYGLILCGVAGEIEAGYEFGQLALKLLEQYQIKAFKSRTEFIVSSFIQHWKEPLHHTLTPLLEAYQSALETGDWVFVALNLVAYSQYCYWSGRELSALAEEMEAYRQVIAQIKQDATLQFQACYQQAVLNLVEQAEVPYRLEGTVFNATEVLPCFQATGNRTGLFYLHLNQTALCYWFGEYELASQQAALAEQYSDAVIGYFVVAVRVFYDALVHLARYTDATPEERSAILERLNAHQAKLQTWATHAPFNHQHRCHLVAAERHRVLGQFAEAMEQYDLAIAQAKESSFIQDEALANELTAKFYLAWGKDKFAALYLQEAYYCYSRWGAKAKMKDLEQRYPQLLSPILQAPHTLNSLETLATIADPAISIYSSTQTNSRSLNTSVDTFFDFTTILKASQSLSSTIQLEELLHQLTQIILQHSGGDRCAFVRPHTTGTWHVEAIATPTTTELLAKPLDGNSSVPVKLIQYVKNTQSVVVIDGLETDLPVLDEYLHQHQPQSILGLPVLNQGQLIGVLVLENRSTCGIFTTDRILVLNFLCTQAAISLENARLYQQAQHYAQQLEHSQLQIVQSEKMASLGNLVAGVAHEINNPIGFLTGSIGNAKDYVQDLLDYIALYQQHHPQAAGPVQEKAEEIDLEFLSEDLLKLLTSMQRATDRIKSISTSLRTFSRADTEHKVRADLHEGIDSTLLILKYRLKANQFRPAIQVVQDYGNLPLVECFPGQLNQVFMNILANAIDMFDEMAQDSTFAELEAYPQQVTIRTATDLGTVKIHIQDNGKGMSEDVKARIFDHLFTTKAVGKGTGLGLAIARQIVEEKHGGQILVNSKLGEGTEFLIQLPA